MNEHLLSPYIRVAMQSTLAPSTIIKKRILFDYELIFVNGGTCTITVEDKPYLCKKGNVVFIPPNVHHDFLVDSVEPFEQPHIHFDPIYSQNSKKTPVSFQAREQMSDEELALIQENIFQDCGIPTLFMPENPKLFQSLFFEIINEFQNKKSGYIFRCKAKLLELLSLILLQFAPDQSSDSTNENAVRAVKNYLDANFEQIITLDSLSTQFYINKFTLIRNFQNFYGENVMAYYKKKRLAFAKAQLIESNATVSTISESLNYNDVYTFSRFFKTQTGLSPKEYRRTKRKMEIIK